MARTSVVTQNFVRTGLVEALAPAVIAGEIIDGGNTALVVNNGGGAPITVTVTSTYTQDGLALANLVVTVAAGVTRRIGPFPSRTFVQPSTAVEGAGRVLVDYSAVTSVTRAVEAFSG